MKVSGRQESHDNDESHNIACSRLGSRV